MTIRYDRRAFTLVELLVVASIMVLFFGLVATNTRPNVGGQIRQAAQELASVLTVAQSRAIGQTTGAAIIFEPSDVDAAIGPLVATTVSNADILPLITGTTTTAGLPLSGTQAEQVLQLVPMNADTTDLENGYKIQLGGFTLSSIVAPYQPPSPWLSYAYGGLVGPGAVSGTLSFRGASGQTLLNTIWPEPTMMVTGSFNPFVFRIARYPTKAELALELPKAVVIDLRYSGLGEDDATIWNQSTWNTNKVAVPGWGTLAGKNAIAITFDAVGGVDALMQQVFGSLGDRLNQPPIAPTEPLYLLVTSRDSIDDPTKPPLSNPQAVWVVVLPKTGRVTVAGNVPQNGIDAAALRAARAKATAGVLGSK